MGITGGFGTAIDLEHGTYRQWFMGRDGVKRWADSWEEVDDPQEISNDAARCGGVGNDIDPQKMEMSR